MRFAAVFGCWMLVCQAVSGAEPARPNIVLVLADDLGYGDLACYGAKDLHTPHLDRFAQEGVRLTSCYSGHPNCSPSRAALLTGRTPTRIGIRNWIPQDSPVHLRASETTIATLLKQAGYATCHVGKWHLNGQFNEPTQPQPRDHGFDHWFATQNNALPNHRNPDNFVRNSEPVGPLKGYAGHLVADEGIKWLTALRDKSKPFFLFVCFHEPHEPIASDAKYTRLYPSEDPSYSAHHGNITQMDDAFGRLMKTLDEQQLRDNTFVFFTSDNGPAITARHPHGSAGPFRDKKGSVFEGGIRVPGIVRWPGKIQPGTVSEVPVGGVDFLPTACEVAGLEPFRERALDGTSFLPALSGQTLHRATPLYWHFNQAWGDFKIAMREGDWKILATLDRPFPSAMNDIRAELEEQFKIAKPDKFALYNLREDPAETRDRADDQPEVLEKLRAKVRAKYDEVQAESPPWPAWSFTGAEGKRIQWPDYGPKGKANTQDIKKAKSKKQAASTGVHLLTGLLAFSFLLQRLGRDGGGFACLSAIVLLLGSFPVAPRAFGADPPTLTHGPMLGHPTHQSMRVWGRTSHATEFEIRYGTEPAKLTQRSPAVQTGPDQDNTGWVEIAGLEPDTRYHYQVFMNDVPQGKPGSFRTLPSADHVRDSQHNPRGLFNFRFEIGSCANQNPLHGIGHSLPTYSTMLRDVRDRVHFAIMNGDWLYEELREFPPEVWGRAQGLTPAMIPRTVQLAPSIVGVWENYRLYLSRGTNLAEWHRTVPSYFTFDDHELVNDIWGTGQAGTRHRRTVFRDIGVQAWYDYLAWANPTQHSAPVWFGRGQFRRGSDLLVDPDANFRRLPLAEMANLHVHWGTPTAGVNEMKYDDDSGDPNAKVYDIVEVIDEHTLRIAPPAVADRESTYSIGRRNYGRFRVANCDFFLLDTRGHRDMHDVRERDKPGLSLLGKTQREWLMSAMQRSDADFFFVVSSVPFMIPHVGAGGFEFDEQNKDESWTVFLDEREQLIRFWETLQRPVLVMTGDLHNSFAIKITDQIWEFCCGPHNSVNHVPVADEADRPATGNFQFGPRPCDIRWSSYVLPDVPRLERLYPYYCVVQVNNVFNSPQQLGQKRWVAYPHPQVIFQYFDGRTGELQYAEAVTAPR